MKIKLKKGLNLSIAGALADNAEIVGSQSSAFAVCPDDFPGLLAKTAVKEGDAVAAGSALLFDKQNPEVKVVSPLAGRVKAVVRGERRKIIRIEVEADNSAEVKGPELCKPSDEDSAKRFLAESGMLALMRQRPYDIVPNPDDSVRDIFITAFDSAPLAPSFAVFSCLFDKDDYAAGIDVLRKISRGKVYLSHSPEYNPGDFSGAECVEVEGPHPSGNVGVQIANIAPVNKGEVVWTLDLPTLGRIGRLARKGDYEFGTVVGVTGPEVAAPTLVRTICGASVDSIAGKLIPSGGRHLRVISGNVFTGTVVDADGYLRYPYRQITVIPEGDDVDEFMGWASLSPSKMSQSRSFPGHFLGRLFRPDARINGGRRAMIMSGEYDKMIPMDILPEYLVKAILSKNIEDMEKLGIYEVAPEDFAAAEYADTSKLPLQQIVRDGLDYLRKELQ